MTKLLWAISTIVITKMCSQFEQLKVIINRKRTTHKTRAIFLTSSFQSSTDPVMFFMTMYGIITVIKVQKIDETKANEQSKEGIKTITDNKRMTSVRV